MADKSEEREAPPDHAPPGERAIDPKAAHVPAPVTALGRVEDVVYYGIAVILLLVAAAALVNTVVEFFGHGKQFAERVTGVINGVLFVVITLELLRTVLAHFHDSSFHLKPFMIIGIISVVRHILTVGAELSLRNDATGHELWHRADIELGVNAAVVLALVIGLVLLRETE